MSFKIIVLIASVLFINHATAWVSVGSSPGFGTCDFLTIQEAIDSNEGEIRVLNNQDFTENLVIDHTVDIKGGYASCLSASLDILSSTNTVIKGTAFLGSSVIEITATNSPIIRFYNLTLRDATDTIFVNGGHGIDIGNSNGLVQITDSLISNNTAENGGGIFINNTIGDLRVVIINTRILGNTASGQGGGIYCNENIFSSNSNVAISVRGLSLIEYNSAEDGGGIASSYGCSITIDSGVDFTPTSSHLGLISNVASRYGGGIYLDGSSSLSLQGNTYGLGNILGNNIRPVTLAFNSANNHGGGIYAINGSTVEIIDGYLYFNKAITGSGGAVYLGDSTSSNVTFSMQSSTTQCWQNGKCSIISNNSADGNVGGAIYVGGGATAELHRTHIYGNTANFGTALYISGPGTTANLEGNYFYDNGYNGASSSADQYVIRVNNSASLSLIHNTIADNDVDDSSAIIGIINGADLTIKNSIISNNPEDVFKETGSNTTDFSCVVASDHTITGSLLFAPNFVDSVNNNYHLTINSGAIDTCASASNLFLDTDNDARGLDVDNVNFNGPYDAGADEYTIKPELVFSDGFE